MMTRFLQIKSTCRLFAIVGLGLGLTLTLSSFDENTRLSPDAHLSDMPEALTNNAVATLSVAGRPALFSFSGLGGGKTAGDISSSAWSYDIAGDRWKRLPDVPGDKHRLASIAVSLGERIFVIGGYTVAADGTEVSTPEVYAFDPVTRTYEARAPMPVPVDDSVVFTYADRYIYLVSGWHDTGNVSDVQVLDTVEDRWASATPYPGAPLFGHAGGIVGNIFVIADGVKVTGVIDGRRQFGISDEAWQGTIAPDDPTHITWTRLPPHPGAPLYRSAATGSARLGQIVFAHGSDNPYNFDGIGYNGEPSQPSAAVFGFDAGTGAWVDYGTLGTPDMDHRGLMEVGGTFFTIGGMVADQKVSARIGTITISK